MPVSKDLNAFEFVIVSALRAAQLVRGCTPRVLAESNDKVTVTARREVEAGKVARAAIEP